MSEADHKIVQQLERVLSSKENLLLAIIFGSYASGKASDSSDIDLALAFQHPLSLEQKIELASELSQISNKEIDIVDLRTASGVLLEQILKNRRTLVNKDSELYGNIIAKRVTEESDFMPLLESMYKKRRSRFHNG